MSTHARQAITVRYLGPTNTRPSRLVAECQAGKLVESIDHASSDDSQPLTLALKLASSLGWNVTHAQIGALPGTGGHVVTFPHHSAN